MAALLENLDASIEIAALHERQTTLMGTVNALHEAMMKRDLETTGPLLLSLVDAARAHFRLEEAMLSAVDFPELREHRRLHGCLLEKVETYYARCTQGEFKMSRHLSQFLRDWLYHHFQTAECAYLGWLRQQSFD